MANIAPGFDSHCASSSCVSPSSSQAHTHPGGPENRSNAAWIVRLHTSVPFIWHSKNGKTGTSEEWRNSLFVFLHANKRWCATGGPMCTQQGGERSHCILSIYWVIIYRDLAQAIRAKKQFDERPSSAEVSGKKRSLFFSIMQQEDFKHGSKTIEKHTFTLTDAGTKCILLFA